VDWPFNGVKNGKKYGTKCSTVPKNAEKIKIKPNQHRLNQLAHLALTPALKAQLQQWLNEDLGRGDLSAAALIACGGKAHWLAKQAGVFCGGSLAEAIFNCLDPNLKIKLLVNDGEAVTPGQRLLELEGSAIAMVAGERTALNLAMHLSGIATATAVLVTELEGTGVRLADTRKTTPGLRILEKYASRCGGAINHRLGLDDAAMLKENHLAWAGGIETAVAAVRAHAPWPAKIIVEAETEAEATAAIAAGADAVLLDEFSPEALQLLVPKLRNQASNRGNPVLLEASGIKPEQLHAYACSGIDLISTSAACTRNNWLDLSMRFHTDKG
jgi:nicotinate-nucleotide pyrophosphorylase (carboxylating)